VPHISLGRSRYSHKHGFVPDADYELLSGPKCKAKYPSPLARGHHTAASLSAAGFTRAIPDGLTMEEWSPECVAADRKFQASTSKGISQGWVCNCNRHKLI
jgi:hypothetical protein